MGIIEKMRLDGKKGFVTGAARGIGKCTATAFAEAGADVAIVDLDYEEAKKTAKELAELSSQTLQQENICWHMAADPLLTQLPCLHIL